MHMRKDTTDMHYITLSHWQYSHFYSKHATAHSEAIPLFHARIPAKLDLAGILVREIRTGFKLWL